MPWERGRSVARGVGLAGLKLLFHAIAAKAKPLLEFAEGLKGEPWSNRLPRCVVGAAPAPGTGIQT